LVKERLTPDQEDTRVRIPGRKEVDVLAEKWKTFGVRSSTVDRNRRMEWMIIKQWPNTNGWKE
jgi:hypothetical protein